ncbi:MAG: N-acetyltransferase family protein [Bacteroidia bacterium]
MLEIQIARSQDAPIIALLARITFTETFGNLFEDRSDLLEYLDHTFEVSKIEMGIAKPQNLFAIAYVNGLPVGYGKLKYNSPSDFVDVFPLCQLQKLYVLQDFLAQKIGYQLQSFLFAQASENGFDNIWLSVLDSNRRAISFYERNGFEEIGKFQFQIGKEKFDFTALLKAL